MSYNTKPIGYILYPVETNFPTWEKWFRTLTIQPQNWTGIQDANLTSVEFLIYRELPHYQLLCWVKWSSHLIRTCKLSYIPDWLYKAMICRVLISSNVRELGFVKSHHMLRSFLSISRYP